MQADFQLSTPAFSHQAPIPVEYSCRGNDTSPELIWSSPPSYAKSLALTVVDPDAPSGLFVHWVLYNIPINTSKLPAGIAPNPILPSGALQGRNDFGRVGYGGPCPPPHQTHRYIFTLYALDLLLDLPPLTTYAMLQQKMEGHILAQTSILGTFSLPP